MNFDQDKESQQFFDKMHSSRGTRNLQQIFEDDDRPLQSESNNLRYQPTQQKSQTAPTTATATTTTTASSNRNNNKSTAEPKWSTLVAKVANGYNGSESVGRVGVALSRNVIGAAKLVIYKSRSQLLSTLLLTKSTTSSSPGEGASRLLMRASYMQFYDDEQRFWSLRFEAAVDEAEFTDALISLGLPIDQKQPEKAQQNAKEEQQQASTSLAASSTASTAASAAGTPRSFQRFKEFEASSCDSDSESTQSNEENILTLPTPAPSKALIPVASTTSSAAPSSGNKLEAYLHEQRANGEAMDRKMDTLLQAMCRLTAANHSSSNSVVSDSASTLKIESVNDVADNDNEDELLELEQKLLDYKKQNRVLAKSLKQREQEMMVLRASTCNLCDKMRNQNNELKKQNRTLIATLADKAKSDDQQDDDDAAGNASCLQCDKYLERIRELEKRVQLLQAVVLDYSKDIKSSSSSNSSGLL